MLYILLKQQLTKKQFKVQYLKIAPTNDSNQNICTSL